jgi:hypothetical protein
MSACDGLSTEELLLISNIPFFDKEKLGFNFDDYDKKLANLKDNKKSEFDAIQRFGDPRISDPVLAYGDNYLPTYDNKFNIPLITLDRDIVNEQGQAVKEMIWIKDGDSPGGVKDSTGRITRFDEGRLRKIDAFETGKAYKNSKALMGDENEYYYEAGHEGDKDYLIIRQSDPYSNIQARITEKMLLNAQALRNTNDVYPNGYPKIIPSDLGYDDIGPRPVQSYKIDFGLGNPAIDLEALQVKTGAVLMHHVNWNNPDRDSSMTQDAFRRAQECAGQKGFGVHTQEVQTRVKAFEDAKTNMSDLLYNHLSQLKPIFNKKRGQTQYDLSNPDNADKVKIGDVWLDIPPTHLLISQLRSSQNVPLLGMESRPQMTSITNRTIIKLNLIFQGEHGINDNLFRILQQFKYVPINIIRSKDIFHKLSKENKFLATQYGSGHESLSGYCVPVTMDTYTLYTIEGHPGCIGCSLEMSLFNPMPYFHNNSSEKIQYIRYHEEIQAVTTLGDMAKVRDVIRMKSKKDDDSAFDPTFDLEESVHPYNFMIEHEKQLHAYNVNHNAPSEINIFKIDNPFSDKHWELMQQSAGKRFTENDCIQLIAASSITENAHSVSLSYSNNFAWTPVLEHAIPTAQFIGPGETQVSVNFKTTDIEAVRQVLRSYKESITPDRFGNFENRFLVQTPILDLADANILTIQNLVVSSVDGKPHLSDVNLIFSKTIFESIARADNDPVKFDNYWGLKRITHLLDMPEYQDMAKDMEKLERKDSMLYKVRNSASVDIDGLSQRFAADLNKALDEISKTKGMQTTETPKSFYESRDSVTQNVNGQHAVDRLQWKQAKLAESISNSADGIDGAFVNNVVSNFNALQKKWEAEHPGLVYSAPGEVQIELDLTSLVVKSESDKGRLKKVLSNFNTYYMLVNGYVATFDLNGISLGELEFLKGEFLKRGFKVGGDSKQLSVSKMPADVNALTKETVTSTAVLDKVITEKMREKIKVDLQAGVLLAKPYAAHRWFNRVDNFISYNKMFSNSVGYWYSQNRLRMMGDEVSTLKTEMDFIGDYMTDTDAYKTVYIKDTWRGLQEEMIGKENSCLNIGRTLAIPSMRKDTTSFASDSRNPINDKSGNRAGLFYPILKNDGQPVTKDFALNKFSTCMFNEHHFKGDPAIVKYMKESFAGNVNSLKNPYDPTDVFDNNMGSRISSVYDDNGRSMGVLTSDGILHKPSATSMKNLHAPLSNQKVNEKQEDYAKKFLSAQICHKTISSKPGGVTGASYKDVNAPDVTPSVKPKSVTPSISNEKQWAKLEEKKILLAMHESVNDTKLWKENNAKLIALRAKYNTTGISDTLPANYIETAGEEIDESTENYLLQQVYNSEAITIGIQNAYPTYKIYIIHDNLTDYKYKALDDYWDFRLLQDLMVIRDRNNPAHILKCRVVVDPRKTTTSAMYDSRYGYKGVNQVTGQPQMITETRNQDDESKINTEEMYSFMGGRSPLRQGMRICVKLGYHSDPRYLDTVFIGTITNLSAAGMGMYEIEGRGDGRELATPSSIQNSSLSGSNFSDLISQMLRSNPSIIHFGRMFGSHIEQFSRRNKNLMNFIMSRANITGLIGTGTSALVTGGTFAGAAAIGMIGASPLAAAAVGTSVGALAYASFGAEGDYGRKMIEAGKMTLFRESCKGNERFSTTFSNLYGRLRGDLFNADKATTQLFRHMADTLENGHNPIDANIFAFDIWASASGSNVTLKANNQRTVWDVLRDIQRIYPGYALDVRPYGSRSTLFLGDPDFHYFRTDDPLLAMAPSFIERSDATRESGNNNDRYRKAIMDYSPRRDTLGNIDPETLSTGILPMVPFQKHHIATSWDNIIYNGVRATPERGWNSVVISKSSDGSGKPEEYVANADIFNHALRRKFAVIDWTNDERLSQQYALGLLKEGVERLYGGTLILRGNSKIEPYDKIYICDKVSKMYGWVQVETVIHKFDSEMGFTTHIVPNMVCKINDTAYSTAGDLRRKYIIGKVSNYWNERGAAGLAIDATSLVLGATTGPWTSLGFSLVANGLLEANKHFAQARENETFVNKYNGLPTDTLDALNKFNWAENVVEWKYSVYADTALAYAGKTAAVVGSSGAKRGLVAAGNSVVQSGRYVFSDVFAGAVKTVFRRITPGEYLSNLMPKKVPDFLNRWATQTADYTRELKAAAVDAALAAETIVDKQVIASMEKILAKKETAWKDLSKSQKDLLKDTKINVNTEKEYEVLLNKMKPKGLFGGKYSAGTKAVGSKLIEGGKKLLGGPLARNVSMLLALSVVMELPSIVEMFAIEAATKGNIVVISPIWFKDSMLMPGLEGYRNNDMWMHMKGMVINAKDAFNEAYSSLSDYEPVKLAADILDPGIQFTGNAFASTPSGSMKLKSYSITEEIVRQDSMFNQLKPMVDEALSKLNGTKKYILEPEVVYGLIQRESGWNPKAIGVQDKNDRGLMQINGKAHPSMDGTHGKDPFDPKTNIDYGVKYLFDLIQTENGDVSRAVSAYNAGHGPQFMKNTDHINAVLSYYWQFKKELGKV